MSAGAPRPRQRRTSTALLFGILAVLFAVFVLWFVIRLSHDPKARSSLGDPVFTIGDARGVANAIDRDGPLLVADPLRRGRNIIVTHVGGKWDVFAVRPSGPGCRVELDRAAKHVVDTCTGPITDSSSLPHYRGTPDTDGRLVIDLRTQVPAP